MADHRAIQGSQDRHCINMHEGCDDRGRPDGHSGRATPRKGAVTTGAEMVLEVPLSTQPLEAAAVDELPKGEGWLFEPKYDGFRCILFRDDDTVHLRSRRQRPLDRYFPEVVEAARRLPIQRFVFDAELIVPDQPFDTLQLRLHPAASRVRLLSREHPAQIVVFDLLADQRGHSLLAKPFRERRADLEATFQQIGRTCSFVLSKATTSRDTARGWLKHLGHGLDGIVAKRLDLNYRPSQRAMQKFKLLRTVDCDVGGIYITKSAHRPLNIC